MNIFAVIYTPGQRGYSKVKVTYKCLPENESRGIRCKTSSKKNRGHLGQGTQKNGFFFWCGLPKMWVIKVCKNAISGQNLQIFMFRLPQNCKISQNVLKERENVQFLCKIWYKSRKKGSLGVEWKRGSLGVRSASKKGVYWHSLDIHRHMGVPPVYTLVTCLSQVTYVN